MRRLLRALRHCVREAWDGLWRNPSLSMLSAASIGISLYVVGLFLMLAFNLDQFVQALGRENQVQIYLKEDARAQEIEGLRSELATDPGVAAARFVSSDEARERFRQTFPALRDLADRTGQNPFPASFELELKEEYRGLDAVDRLAKSYRKAPAVEEVRYDPGWIQRLA